MPLLTPAQQAAIELRRPGAQVPGPLVVGGILSIYPASIAAIAGAVPGVAVLATLMGLTGVYTVRRYRKHRRDSAGRVLNSAFNLVGLGRLREAAELLDLVEAK